MPRTKAFSPADVVDRALQIFWQRGYRGTSMEDLTSSTGLSRSSLYAEYGSKRNVFDRAVDRYLDVFRLTVARTDKDGLSGIVSLFAGLEESIYFKPEYGCLMVNTRAEFARGDRAYSRSYAAYDDLIVRTFRTALDTSAVLGELDDPEQASVRSHHLATILVGLFAQARGSNDLSTVLLRAEAAIDQVESWRRRSLKQRPGRPRPLRPSRD